MWYEKQFRDSGNLTTLLQAIRQIATFPIRIMEVCGGQTYALSRYRIEELLPDTVQMIHGPGCPVCVTHEDTISQAIEIARNPQTIFCTFGDMVRVPGTKGSLQQLKAEGSRLLRHRIRDDQTPIHFVVARNRLPKNNQSILADLLVHHTRRHIVFSPRPRM